MAFRNRFVLSPLLLALSMSSLTPACAVERCPPMTVERDGYCMRQPVEAAMTTNSGVIEGASCKSDMDCVPMKVDAQWTCDEPEKCRGSRPQFMCMEKRCTLAGRTRDDRACTEETEADDCGPYPSALCNGEAMQSAPKCGQSCASADDCDPEMLCLAGKCSGAGTLKEGDACKEDRACSGGRCLQGACCDRGDCCDVASDCPAKYRRPAQCTQPMTCQGTRGDAACMEHKCAPATVDDDTACAVSVVAQRCPGGTTLSCTGAAEQSPPSACPAATDPGTGGKMSSPPPGPPPAMSPPPPAMSPPPPAMSPPPPAMSPPSTPPPPACNPPSCCKSASDCPAASAVCTNLSKCQGTKTTYECVASKCVAMQAPDPVACKGQTAADCGYYKDVICDGTSSQDLTCSMDCLFGDMSKCDQNANLVCSAGECGTRCTSNAQCLGGLECRGTGGCCDPMHQACAVASPYTSP